MEKARLVRLLGTALDQELEEDDIFIIEDDHEEPVSKISPADSTTVSVSRCLKFWSIRTCFATVICVSHVLISNIIQCGVAGG